MNYTDVRVVGMHFRGADAITFVAASKPGETLSLEREPENRFDNNAIKILSRDGSLHIGYVNKDDAAWIAPELDAFPESSPTVTITSFVIERNNTYPIVTISDEE